MTPYPEVRRGHVIVVRDTRWDDDSSDPDKIRMAFGKLGFEFPEPYHHAGHRDEVMKYIKGIEARDPVDLLLVYIIAEVFGKEAIVDESGRAIYPKDITNVFSTEKMKDTKLLLFFQMDFEMKREKPVILVNRMVAQRKTYHTKAIKFPRSKNTLVAHLPTKREMPNDIIEILCEELSQPVTLDLALTYALSRADSLGEKGTAPVFYSNIAEMPPLHQMELKPETSFSIPGKKRLAYAFLLENDKEGSNSQLPLNGEEDEVSLKSAFGKLGFEVMCKRGSIQSMEISKEVRKIAEEKVTLKDCELLSVIISSYGMKNSRVADTEQDFNLTELLAKFNEYKSIPKLIIFDGEGVVGKFLAAEIRKYYPFEDTEIVYLPDNSYIAMTYVAGVPKLRRTKDVVEDKSEMAVAKTTSFLGQFCTAIEEGLLRDGGVDVMEVVHDVMKMANGEGEPDSTGQTRLKVGYGSNIKTPLLFRKKAEDHETEGNAENVGPQQGV